MNRTIASDLPLVNSARARLNMPPLKSWKGSHAKLQATLVELNERIKTQCATQLPVTDAALIRESKRREKINAVAQRILDGDDNARPEREPVLTLPDRPKPSGRPKVKIEGTVSLADIARDVGISPKIARAKMRKKKVDFEVAQYVYPQDRVDEIKHILRHR